MKRQIILVWILLVAAVFFLGACGGGSGGGTSSSDDGTGTLRLSLVDAPGGSYQAVYVTIKEVQVCAAEPSDGDGEEDCDWLTVATPNETYNLLELVNGVMATLGQEDLPAGTYNQMRLLLSCTDDLSKSPVYPNYLIDMDGNPHEMKVPSGCQSGIKLVHPFDITENMFTELILDFDVARSVVKAGNSGKYLLKPTIKVIGTHDYAIVSGTVNELIENDEGEILPSPVSGASVTVWQPETDDSNPITSTVTDDNGDYTLYLDLGQYTLVATAEGFTTACRVLLLEDGQAYPDTDFSLDRTVIVTVEDRTVTGTLGIPAERAPVVTISFRQVGHCFSEPLEAAFVLVGDDPENQTYDYESGFFSYTYDTPPLPSGSYQVTAETDDGQLTWGPVSINLPPGDSTVLNIEF